MEANMDSLSAHAHTPPPRQSTAAHLARWLLVTSATLLLVAGTVLPAAAQVRFFFGATVDPFPYFPPAYVGVYPAWPPPPPAAYLVPSYVVAPVPIYRAPGRWGWHGKHHGRWARPWGGYRHHR